MTTPTVEPRPRDRRLSEIPDALASRHQATAMLRTRRYAVFLDFDGTLAHLADDPSAATLVDGAAEELARLARYCPVGVISGRDVADLQARVGVPGLWYAGSHGFELVGPDGTYHRHEAADRAVPDLGQLAVALRDSLAAVPGVLVEPKRFTVAVHHRHVAGDRMDEVLAAVRDAAGRDGPLRVTHGRGVTELRPDVEWDKGRAVAWVLEHVRGAGDPMPVYIGDDLTGDEAFGALTSTGIGVVVRHPGEGDRRSTAQFAVDGPDRVREILQRLADLLGSDPGIAPPPDDAWTMFFDGYDPSTEKLREALCTVGNGYFATRGCAPESRADGVHYPGTYVAGIFNRLDDEVSGSIVDHESLVNLPNWLPVTFRVDGGQWFDLDSAELLDYHQYLDLRRAVLTRRLRFRDAAGRTTSVRQRRFVAMNVPHACALETTIAAEDWSGRLEIRSLLDGTVRNSLVERYRALADEHLEPLQSTASRFPNAGSAHGVSPFCRTARRPASCSPRSGCTAPTKRPADSSAATGRRPGRSCGPWHGRLCR